MTTPHTDSAKLVGRLRDRAATLAPQDKMILEEACDWIERHASDAVSQEFPYRATFDAIAAAAKPNWEARTIAISVQAFQHSFNATAPASAICPSCREYTLRVTNSGAEPTELQAELGAALETMKHAVQHIDSGNIDAGRSALMFSLERAELLGTPASLLIVKPEKQSTTSVEDNGQSTTAWRTIESAPDRAIVGHVMNGKVMWAELGVRGKGALGLLWYTPYGKSIPTATHWIPEPK